jgi:hypothetical protein
VLQALQASQDLSVSTRLGIKVRSEIEEWIGVSSLVSVMLVPKGMTKEKRIRKFVLGHGMERMSTPEVTVESK